MKIDPKNIREKSIISHQFAKAVRKLVEDGKIDDVKSFCIKYHYNKGLLANIESGKQEAPKDILYQMVIDFKLNPAYFFPTKGKSESLYL